MEEVTSKFLNFAEELRNGLRPQPPVSQTKINALIELCWHSDPKERPTMKTVCETIQLLLRDR